jgi:phage tail tape-measure protein
MRKILFATIAVAALAGVPSLAGAEEAGAVAGGVAGAAAGAAVGGPVGAAVGGAVGATTGAAVPERRDREVIIERDAPAVDSKTCVTHADGTRVCREISR